jgi:hypothetical protein
MVETRGHSRWFQEFGGHFEEKSLEADLEVVEAELEVASLMESVQAEYPDLEIGYIGIFFERGGM